MDLGLQGHKALVGGASRGLGRAAAEALAAAGCDLLLWARDEAALADVARTVSKRHGVRAEIVTADAYDPATPQRLHEAATSTLGDVDVLVLNSGGPPRCGALETDRESWEASFRLLCTGPVELATRLIPGMQRRGWGRVVAILSSGVRQPIPGLVYSNACRSALVAWLKTAAAELASSGVTLNGVLPGRLATDRVAELDEAMARELGVDVAEVRRRSTTDIPAGRYGDPAELGSVVAFLCSAAASYVTGALVPVDGGMIKGVA